MKKVFKCTFHTLKNSALKLGALFVSWFWAKKFFHRKQQEIRIWEMYPKSKTSQILKVCFVFPLSFVFVKLIQLFTPTALKIFIEKRVTSGWTEDWTFWDRKWVCSGIVTHDRRWGFTFRLRTLLKVFAIYGNFFTAIESAIARKLAIFFSK